MSVLYINITAFGMQHTINQVINDSYSGVVCESSGSKLKYYKLAIGGDTKFTMLYVDFDISETHVANTNMEGGIRPPSYIETAHTHCKSLWKTYKNVSCHISTQIWNTQY